MNEPSNNNPSVDRGAVSEAVSNALRQPSFLKVMIFLATTVVVLVGMRLSAPVLNPVLFAVVFALVFSPIYAWLRRRRVPTPLALLIMLVGLAALFLGIFFILSVSIARFSGEVGSYTVQLNDQLQSLQGVVKSLGVSTEDVRKALSPNALAGAIGAVLGGIADFLSNVFLILAITLFLIAEGPAMMSRLRAVAGPDHPQLASVMAFGHSVILQIGLRAVVNLFTGAGVVVLLLVCGVPFPLMWGILTFFLSFIPWIGLPLAVAPAVILALLESGWEWALAVILGVVVINVVAENLLSPMLMGRGLSLSPTIVFLSFIFWAWLLGGPGAFLAVPLTIFVALIFQTFPETRWIASLVVSDAPDAEAAPPPKREVAEPAT